ncbi:Oxygen-independent coproporphyrinogen-III oxidase-like protein YqeR [Neochlamydia sp. AcF65]|uniref:radical SAM family heme chaperone HemW n=1 Tax=Neochlamydia sp. AcF65 TaxID=2795735 RepID=UPI001BC9E500|nr:radical SAM family heme chaperone HemW [Neochlamydia sp. AcF65]MBS4166536.1 Oxygen-independent coproporphyrinogen-III oxidase-like protein YqeR [Neochlamydia sp. AcF65]
MPPPKEPISLYFHIPFCTHKCGYCHFYVLPNRQELKDIFMQALAKEWSLRLPDLIDKEIVSIYFGGGTPSLLGVEYLSEIIEWIKRDVNFDPLTTEVTLEANPETITFSLMQAYALAGVNRVSIGIQTLSNTLLEKLERQHSAEKAIEAVWTSYEAGIKNLTIDLMYDLPNQTLAIWKETLLQVSQLPIKHLSLYNLTIEPHTTFFKYRNLLLKTLPDPDLSLQMYEMAQAMLNSCQLKQYEISAFAQEGFQSKHNTGYWAGRPFLGFGPSAFSYWKGKRFRNIAHLKRYAYLLSNENFPLDFEEQLDPEASQRELLTIRLRMREGIDLKAFQQTHGALSQETLQNLTDLEEQGFIHKESNRISLSQQGVLFYDTVATELI